jgi:dUTP pyrophosphatase
MNETQTCTPNETTVLIRIGPGGRQPLYATAGSAGCDLFAATALVIRPGERCLLPLNLILALEPGVEAQIRPRSGLSLRTSLRLANTPGTLDSDYRNEVCVLVENTFSQAGLAERILLEPTLAAELSLAPRTTLADILRSRGETEAAASLEQACPELAGRTIWLDDQGNPFGTLYFAAGDRIAQMILARHLSARFIAHADPAAVGNDRGGGFGSTGS